MQVEPSLRFPRYQALLSIDLRCFDLREPDYGVGKYFETLGFLPHILLLHETNLDQVHLHDGIIDETKLDYLWCTQRGMPGCQVWSRRQLRELVDVVHTYGVKFYQGLEATWQSWPQYDSKSVWPYQHDEIFITLSNGKKTCEGELQTGAINPLSRMRDGSWYEDLLCRDLIRYLTDYNMDGYFSADGMAGLSVTLQYGDYSDDMIDQFTTYSGVAVQGKTTPEKADYIWNRLRREWIDFYVQRWVTFYRKLSGALKGAGKGIATMDAWARSPADSVYDFGFDYLRLNEAGLDFYCLESREENWGRRGHGNLYAWEPGQVVTAATIKARAPDLTVLWALCTCNAPENWHAVRDVPIVLERQLMTLPLTSYIDEAGHYRRAYDGFLAIFGIDLSRDEWDWMTRRLDFSFHPELSRVLGPALVWSDAVHERYLREGVRWNITAPATQLITAGLPLRSAINTRNLKNARAEGYVLVDSRGITEPEVDALLAKVEQGADLILIGEIGSARLRAAAGLTEGEPVTTRQWKTTPSLPADVSPAKVGTTGEDLLLRYLTGAATSLIEGQNGRVVFSRFDSKGGGSFFYFASTRPWKKDLQPNMAMSGFTESMVPVGEVDYMHTLVNDAMPNPLELLAAALLRYRSALSVSVDIGQYAAYEAPGGDIVIHLENIANLFYTRPRIATTFPIAGVRHFPIKTPSPAGYVIDRTTTAHGCQVNVLPDGVVPLALLHKYNDRT